MSGDSEQASTTPERKLGPMALVALLIFLPCLILLIGALKQWFEQRAAEVTQATEPDATSAPASE